MVPSARRFCMRGPTVRRSRARFLQNRPRSTILEARSNFGSILERYITEQSPLPASWAVDLPANRPRPRRVSRAHFPRCSADRRDRFAYVSVPLSAHDLDGRAVFFHQLTPRAAGRIVLLSFRPDSSPPQHGRLLAVAALTGPHQIHRRSVTFAAVDVIDAHVSTSTAVAALFGIERPILRGLRPVSLCAVSD